MTILKRAERETDRQTDRQTEKERGGREGYGSLLSISIRLPFLLTPCESPYVPAFASDKLIIEL